MADFVANGPISVPLYIPGLKADVDLGGLKFSYDYGLCYTPTSTTVSITPPPPMEQP